MDAADSSSVVHVSTSFRCGLEIPNDHPTCQITGDNVTNNSFINDIIYFWSWGERTSATASCAMTALHANMKAIAMTTTLASVRPAVACHAHIYQRCTLPFPMIPRSAPRHIFSWLYELRTMWCAATKSLIYFQKHISIIKHQRKTAPRDKAQPKGNTKTSFCANHLCLRLFIFRISFDCTVFARLLSVVGLYVEHIAYNLILVFALSSCSVFHH